MSTRRFISEQETRPGEPATPTRTWLALGLAFLLASVIAAPAAPQFVPGRILVKTRGSDPDKTLVNLLGSQKASQARALGHSKVRAVSVREQDVEAVLASLREAPDIEFAERDGIGHVALVPNDPYFLSCQEWHLNKIRASQAWDISTGKADLLIAVLDTGVNFAHPDLNGRVVPGYDFVANTNVVVDDMGHGTAVAGVLAASGNNGLGVVGVAFNCTLLAVKVADNTGSASYSTIVEGIRYSVDHGARIINVSIAGDAASSALQDAVNYAWSHGAIVVAAAGNDAVSTPQYPAACDHVVGVGATEPDDSLASFSNFGSYVTLTAPGDGIWTTQRDLDNPYGSWRGTSFASPIVAGVAALIASSNPSLSNTQIVSCLVQGADDLGPAGQDPIFGYGRLNALTSLRLANPTLPPQLPPPTVGVTLPVAGSIFAFGSPIPLQARAAAATGALSSVQFLVDGAAVALVTQAPFVASWTPSHPGAFSVTAVAIDTYGYAGVSSPVAIRVAGTLPPPPPTPVPSPSPTPLVLNIAGAGRVMPDLNGALLEIGQSYSVRALPAKGQIFSGWAGAEATTPALTFVMRSNLVLTANFIPSPFPAVKGSYAGLVADTNTVSPETSGYFTLNVTTMGRFSGRLTLGTLRAGFSGQLDFRGQAAVAVKRRGQAPLQMSLQVDLAHGTDQASGSLTDGQWRSELSGDRNVFQTRLNPAPQAGLRGFILQEVDTGAVAATAANGVGRISASGATTVRGKLADGRKFHTASFLAGNGDFPFYLSLNRGSEVLIGWLNFPAAQDPGATGVALWVKSGTNAFTTRLQAAAAPAVSGY